MQNPILKNVVNTRLALKSLLVRNGEMTTECANKALDFLAQEDIEAYHGQEGLRPYTYISRKIEGFSQKEKISLLTSIGLAQFTKDTEMQVPRTVQSAYKACQIMYKSPETVKFFETHAVKRKKYKQEITDLFTKLHKTNRELPLDDLLPLEGA